MAEGADLYEQDFVAWTEQQAERIRAATSVHSNLHIDWDRVAEEIEDLGKSIERELQNRLATIIEHLLKLQYFSEQDPGAGWIRTVLRTRAEIESLMEENPSLRTKLDRVLPAAHRLAARLIKTELEVRRRLAPAELRALDLAELTRDQVLGNWLPEQPTS